MTSGVARNYARALFQLAAEDSTIPAVEADLRAARDALFEDREARDFLASRVVGRSPKRRLVLTAFQGTVDPRVLTLLLLVAERGRARLLGEIDDEYERLSRIARGVRRATILSAFPLGEEEQARIRGALEKRYGGTVELRIEINPSLIGGVLALSEGQEIEFSASGQLRDLQDSLTPQAR
ncbi:MAG TPA: ATP synthase F1 subunit delta [Spirochaetia bacterium]|nr:ATP synthase F1 subunit delta [Spirochaetia bacterium]